MKFYLPTLYKSGARGQILQWTINVRKKGEAGVLIITHGQKDGKMMEDREIVEEGKNIGQSNATTPTQQARAQARARWKKQFDRYYRETITEAEKAIKNSTNPMLAHKYMEKADTALIRDEEIGLQPKLDGMRCLARREGKNISLLSRGGKLIYSVPHVNAELMAFLKDGDTWDGELYVHGMEFEKIISICKRKANNLHPECATMQLHIFDMVGCDGFVTRCAKSFGALERAKSEIVQLVPTEFDTHQVDTVRFALKYFEDKGYEGVIVRKLDMPYEHKRSVQLLKLKNFIDAEFKIVGSLTGKRGSGQDGLLVKFILDVTLKDGTKGTFEGTLMGKKKLRREMWGRRDGYVGKLATVVYQEVTNIGKPRFAKVKAIRGKEDLSS